MNPDPDLPTLERARAAAKSFEAHPIATTIFSEPSESKLLAAIVFAADLLRRETWEEEVELAPALFERYPRDAPPVANDFREAGYQLVDALRASQRGRCKNCFLSPGTVLCTRCFGNPTIDEGTCRYCRGEPVTCSVCDGSGETVRATLRHVNDRPIAVRNAFFPELPEALVAEVEAIVGEVQAPHESRRIALQANVVESAYRGASALRAPEFRGHSFGSALEAALRADRELDRYANVVRREVRAYAWPILVLRFDETSIAVLDDREGRLRIAGVDSGGPRRTT